MTRKPLTKKGAEKLRQDLRRLKTVDRPRVIQAIAEARAHGDLSENAEYHAAREQQGFIEGRIKSIEHALSHCEIIDVSGAAGEHARRFRCHRGTLGPGRRDGNALPDRR